MAGSVTPRILAIMGSGETAPTMAKVHRLLFARLGPPPVAAAMLDTPYGFQENAGEITARALEYFRENVGYPMQLAPFRSGDADPVERATSVARLREARYVFAGPGSPSYALRQWMGTEVPDLLVDKLTRGGVVTFASAAALTLGRWSVPVYEIYKVGEVPRWLEGMDVMGRLGFNVAVVPHYDNAEGGTHDTRFCYLGERRLSALELELPEDAFVLGVDSHTALVMDLDAGVVSVLGLGGITVRVRGASEVYHPGSTLTIDALREAAARLMAAHADAGQPSGPGVAAAAAGSPALQGEAPASLSGTPGREAPAAPLPAGAAPLLDEVHKLELAFETALGHRNVHDAVRSILALESTLVDWSRDTGLNDQIDQARSILQALIVRLGELSDRGARDPRELVAPFVEALLELRRRARDTRDWSTADLVRDRLIEAGVEVRDTAEGTEWEMRSPE
jgi:hypothetical protein